MKGYFIYSWWDETSQYDDNPTKRWVGGSEYYEAQYSCWLPDKAKEWTDEEIDEYIDSHSEDDNFWVEIEKPSEEGLGDRK